ncbi:hypothetical protein [Avibacterium gallinarum]|uniref:hypothetical protein n=1 Tax=Avibacterium gallinarum TaxID=755 RepID=UPI0039FD30DD
MNNHTLPLDKVEQILFERSVNSSNEEQGTIFPFLREMIEMNAQILQTTDNIEGLSCLATELHYLTKHLLKVDPIREKTNVTSAEDVANKYTLEEVHHSILKMSILNDLAKMLNQLSDSAMLRIMELEQGNQGGIYGKTH